MVTEAPTPLNDVSNGSTFHKTFRLPISLEVPVKTIAIQHMLIIFKPTYSIK